MDRLDQLPLGDDQLTDDEDRVLKQYFGDSVPDDVSSGSSWSQTFKTVGYGTLLFATLANPWINNLVYKIPYINGNPIVAFCFKLFVFTFFLMIATRIAA